LEKIILDVIKIGKEKGSNLHLTVSQKNDMNRVSKMIFSDRKFRQQIEEIKNNITKGQI
jgi:hypothetical protein